METAVCSHYISGYEKWNQYSKIIVKLISPKKYIYYTTYCKNKEVIVHPWNTAKIWVFKYAIHNPHHSICETGSSRKQCHAQGNIGCRLMIRHEQNIVFRYLLQGNPISRLHNTISSWKIKHELIHTILFHTVYFLQFFTWNWMQFLGFLKIIDLENEIN